MFSFIGQVRSKNLFTNEIVFILLPIGLSTYIWYCYHYKALILSLYVSNLAFMPPEYGFHQYLATYPVYEAVNGVDLFLHLDMFAQHCAVDHPPGSENFISWTSRLYSRKCFQIAKRKYLFSIYERRWHYRSIINRPILF